MAWPQKVKLYNFIQSIDQFKTPMGFCLLVVLPHRNVIHFKAKKLYDYLQCVTPTLSLNIITWGPIRGTSCSTSHNDAQHAFLTTFFESMVQHSSSQICVSYHQHDAELTISSQVLIVETQM